MVEKTFGRYDFSRYLTQLLLMESEEDLNKPKISELLLKCGESADEWSTKCIHHKFVQFLYFIGI